MGARRMRARKRFLHPRDTIGGHKIGVLGDRTVGKLKAFRAIGSFDKGPAHVPASRGWALLP
jgi:hypothetical protein